MFMNPRLISTSRSFVADGIAGPSPRSVGVLILVVIGGRMSLVTLFGERDPSSLGHQGAGKMLGDVWVFDVDSGAETGVDAQGDEGGKGFLGRSTDSWGLSPLFLSLKKNASIVSMSC